MKRKHAYLIMAHNDFYVLEKLLMLIDDTRNDIYIHIDSKCTNIDEYKIKNIIVKSNVYFLNPRMNIKWGGVTQVECEIKLLKLAITNRNYEYIHLLSGVDLPLKNQDEIHQFFSENRGKEFIGFNNFNQESKKIKYFYFFQEVAPRKKNGNSIKVKMNNFTHVFFRVLDRILILAQKLFFINRIRNCDEVTCRGSNWISITSNLAGQLVSNENEILKKYKYTAYPDEIFVQTYVYNNNNFRDNLYDLNDEYNGCLRHIDWKRGWPYTFMIDDKLELLNSDKIFARKFSSEKDKEIIDFIYNKIKNDI